MPILKKILLLILLLPVGLALVSVFLPAQYRVERSLRFNAPPEAIFTNINTLTTWPAWTAWTVERFPDLQASFAGPASGVGASYAWTGRSCGSGRLKVTGSEPGRGIEFESEFEPGKFVSSGAIKLEPDGEATLVIWSSEGELGRNPVARYFGLFMDGFMGPDLEKGLQNLKRRLEPKSG